MFKDWGRKVVQKYRSLQMQILKIQRLHYLYFLYKSAYPFKGFIVIEPHTTGPAQRIPYRCGPVGCFLKKTSSVPDHDFHFQADEPALNFESSLVLSE